MSFLLVADLHFDDKAENEYRWSIFEDILKAHPEHVYILGDLCHKKDRYSAALVNRLIGELRTLRRRGILITVLCGNHDEPLKGPPYWTFLNDIPGTRFITQPTSDGRLLLLPHSSDPGNDWSLIDFTLYNAIFMHQPVSGMDLGNGRLLDVEHMITFPPELPVYSGDAHYPQRINGVEYIGTPYPINYGENHKYRMLLLDSTSYHIEREIVLRPISKHSLTVNSVAQLEQLYVRKGDQAKIEFVLPASRVDQWPVEREAIGEWARANGVAVAAIKAVVETSPAPGGTQTTEYSELLSPAEVLIEFAEIEGIEEALLITGYTMLEEALTEAGFIPEWRSP